MSQKDGLQLSAAEVDADQGKAQEAPLEVIEGDEGDNEAYVSYDIASYPADYTLSVIAKMWEDGDIIVPTFQRKFVWSIKQSSLLIESLLMGLPVPQAFFYVDADGRNLVIDGLQRIKSIVAYFSGRFGEEEIHGRRVDFKLAGLSEKSPYDGKAYAELDDADQRRLRNSVLRVINVRQLGPKNDDTSAYHIFERLNTGGTPLTVQEIRHCVYHGKFVDMLIGLNKNSAWRKILGKESFDKHQKDVELVLRVFAIYSRADVYEKPMKEFLNKALASNVAGDSVAASRFIERFPVVASELVEMLGSKPFNTKGRLNASALDSVMGTLMSMDALPQDLSERYSELLRDDVFLQTLSVSTSDSAVVRQRLSVVRKHLLG